jgi:predicted RNA-binding protein
MTDWMLITSRHSWELLCEAGAWKFADKSLRRAKEIQPGQKALVYLTHESVFAAIVEFTASVQTVVPERIFDGLFPHKVPFRVIQAPNYSVPIHRHIPDLAFIKNKKSWSSHLQGQAIRPIEPADFRLISTRLNGSSGRKAHTSVSST